MRALVSDMVGPPETLVLRNLPEPVPGPGQVLVTVEACGLNYPDVLMINDQYQFKPERPFAPGIEICGRIERLGGNVEGLTVGSRVVAQAAYGGLAEKAVIDADRALLVPSGLNAQVAASILLTYGTSYHALKDRGQLKADETLLVLGGGGGVGLAAIELGKMMGAQVIAGVSSAQKANVARAAGADHVLLYAAEVEQRALTAQFKAACPDGVDVVFDPIGGAYAEPALRCINWDGRYLTVGYAGGIPRIPLNLALLKGAKIVGVFWGAWASRHPKAMRDSANDLLRWIADGLLRPHPPTTFQLEEAPQALSALANREAVGKLVVIINNSAA